MTDQENFNVQVQRQIDALNERFSAFIQEMRDFKTEMRDRDNQRSAEIRALRQETDAKFAQIRQETDAKLAATNEKIAQIQERTDSKIDSISKEIHNLVLAAMVGIGAIAVAVVGFVISRS